MRFIALFVLLAVTVNCYEMEVENDKITLDEFILLLKGMFEGMDIEHDMEEIIKCITHVPDAAHVLIAALEKLIHLDIKNLKEVVELIIQMVGAIKEIINVILPCVSTIDEWKKILEKLSKLDINKILNRLVEKIFDIVAEIKNIKNAILKKDYESLGKSLGYIVYIIFLEEK